MIKSSIELLSEPIGFDIANSDDISQSGLINGMGRGFQTFNRDQLNMQMCYVSQKLTTQGQKWILELAEFIKLNNG